ncbi:MAG: hypothetical protein SGI91_09130, partial [Alphaproteobacteria bacterium]|nr:hypothetical protein [Alphaproteobacteria bacterium]
MRPVIIAALIALIVVACERTVPTVVAPPSPPMALGNDQPAAELFAAVRTGTGGAPMVIGSYTR